MVPKVPSVPLETETETETHKELKQISTIFYTLVTIASKTIKNWSRYLGQSGTHPGFPIGGGTNPPGGHQHMILPNFPKNCMNLRKFWTVGGCMLGASPRSATGIV